MHSKRFFYPLLGIAFGLAVHTHAAASRISVTVENLSPSGGLYFTPTWIGFHDGSFDSFDVGGAASGSIEAVAEGGALQGIMTDFGAVSGGRDGVVTAPAGFGGAPVFDPGDSGSLTLSLDPVNNRYFSFLSMVIPSNDAFFGNDSGTAYQVFDATGAFTGPLDIYVLGTEIWDGGTEVNDGQGAAFSQVGGTSTDESLPIAVHSGLDSLFNTTTVAGTVIDPAFSDITQGGYQLARISVKAVPEPHGVAMIALGLGLVRVWGRGRPRPRVDGDGSCARSNSARNRSPRAL